MATEEHAMRFKKVDEVVADIRAAYEETPDLQLTLFQAQHAWNLSADLCERALHALLLSGFLNQTQAGFYIRRATPSAGVLQIEALLRAM
jgi:hypothetical protein